MTDLDIVNLALARVKETPLTSLTEARPAADVARAAYPFMRDKVLRLAPWAFAQRRVSLAALSTTPLGFKYQHNLPADFLALGAVAASADMLQHSPVGAVDVVYRLEAGTILADSTPLYVLYTARVVDASQFDPLFVEVVICHLAAHFQAALHDDQTAAARALEDAKGALRQARIARAIEQAGQHFEPPGIISGRNFREFSRVPRVPLWPV